MKQRGIILLVVVFYPSWAFAGGAAVQQRQQQQQRQQLQIQQQGVRVHEKVRAQRPQPGVWPMQAPEIVATPTPTPKPVIRPAVKTKPAQVLVSDASGKKVWRPSGSSISAPELTMEQSLSQLLGLFDQSSEMWLRLDDVRYKILVVSRYVDLYSRDGVTIKKPSMEYVTRINEMAAADPRLLTRPFKDVLKLVAILEYDFANGQNPDALTRKILDEKTFQKNKQRLGRR